MQSVMGELGNAVAKLELRLRQGYE
jgi:hypothetical protein